MDDEQDEVNQGVHTRTRIFNIEDLENPFIVPTYGIYDGPNLSSDHNLYVHQDLVFESNYTSGIQILDATSIGTAALNQVASFDTYPSSNANGYNGAWGNYPFFASGIVVVNDIQSGLFILRPRLSLRLKAMLEGPYDQVSGMMKDDLRAAGLVPAPSRTLRWGCRRSTARRSGRERSDARDHGRQCHRGLGGRGTARCRGSHGHRRSHHRIDPARWGHREHGRQSHRYSSAWR
jgi:hypothetical protein